MENVVKAIIFDMDGVLLDSETISWRTWELAAEELGLLNIKEAARICTGSNRKHTVKVLKDIYGADFDSLAFINRASELFEQIEFTSGIPLMPFVKETLEYLSSRYMLAVASSTRSQKVNRQLAACGIINYFKTLTCGDMVERSKPHPDIYLKAAESLGIAAEECVAVEDSPNGVRSATAAKIRTIMVPDKIQPTEEIRGLCWKICQNLSELRKFL